MRKPVPGKQSRSSRGRQTPTSRGVSACRCVQAPGSQACQWGCAASEAQPDTGAPAAGALWKAGVPCQRATTSPAHHSRRSDHRNQDARQTEGNHPSASPSQACRIVRIWTGRGVPALHCYRPPGTSTGEGDSEAGPARLWLQSQAELEDRLLSLAGGMCDQIAGSRSLI